MKKIIFLIFLSQLCVAQPGELDSSFNPYGAHGSYNTIVQAIAVQPDGKIIVGGHFQRFNGVVVNHIARLNTDGSLDVTFNSGTGFQGEDNSVKTIIIQWDGKIVIGGTFPAYNGVLRNNIVRLNTDGTLDTSFLDVGGAGLQSIEKMVYQPVNGSIALIGTNLDPYTPYNIIHHVRRLNTDGSLDATFTNGFSAVGFMYTLAIQPDGKILVGGSFADSYPVSNRAIARINADGSFDSSFYVGSKFNNAISTISVQPDGKIIVSGGFTAYGTTVALSRARLNSDGSLDTVFTNTISNSVPGMGKCIIQQPDGKMLLCGDSYVFGNHAYIARINADGSLDSTFNTNVVTPMTPTTYGTVYSMALQTDGKVIIVGNFTSYNGIDRKCVARLNGEPVLGIEQHEHNDITLYPNPANNLINLEFSNNVSIDKVSIADICGKTVFEQTNGTEQINIENLAQGIYIVQAFSGSEKFKAKFVKL